MKHVHNNCKRCKGESVVLIKGKTPMTDSYVCCPVCNPTPEDKECDMSGADEPGDEGNR